MNRTIACQPVSPGPEEIGLPVEAWDKLNVFMTAAEGVSKAAVAECCYPKILNVANDCVMWCEVPPKYLQEAKTGRKTPAVSAMSDCIRAKSNGTMLSATMKSASAAADMTHGRKTVLGLWALLLAGYMTMGN